MGRRRRLSGSLVAVACLFALIQAGGAWPVRGEVGKCVPTGEDAEGPFYKPGAPERLSTGSGLAVSGDVISYPDCRPIHIHFKVSVPGHKPLTTQLYLRGGEKAIRFDLVVEAEQRYR